MTLSGELWDRFCSLRVRSRTLLTHLTTALCLSLSPWCLLLPLLLHCIYKCVRGCVCVCLNQREVFVVDRSSIGLLVLWVKTQTDYWRAQSQAHPSTVLNLHLYVHIYRNTLTNIHLTTSISFNTCNHSSNWCVSTCVCTCMCVYICCMH